MSYILLVDDQPKSITRASRHLKACGHRTALLTNGREAIAKIREEAPDILVIDTVLPFVDGFLVIQELRHLYPAAGTQVILLTTLQADGEPGRDWSMPTIQSYILKHVDTQTLAWQIVLAVEQCVYRRMIPRETDDP